MFSPVNLSTFMVFIHSIYMNPCRRNDLNWASLTRSLIIDTFLLTFQVLISSKNKQEYVEMLHHNFAQCVILSIWVLDTLPPYINYEFLFMGSYLPIYMQLDTFLYHLLLLLYYENNKSTAEVIFTCSCRIPYVW